MSPGCNYGGVYCLMFGILVLCFGKNEITCHPGATMAECIVLCLGYLSYVWDICVMYGMFVLCMGCLIVDLAFCT